MANKLPVMVAHGGAWAVPDATSEETLQCVKNAAKIGYRILLQGGSCIDAVVAVVSALEDNPLYDAGKGSLLTTNKDIEMHAMVMKGDTMKCGGVLGVQRVKNPVQVARLVMEKTEHCMLDGENSLLLAKEHNVPEMPLEYFVTDSAQKEFDTFMKYRNCVDTLFNSKRDHDTVGAVALDLDGNVACATSTGGITGQMPGRVSDSGIPGSGGFADNNSLAVSSTGHGESIIKVSLARLASLHSEQGCSPQESVNKALKFMKDRTEGHGGAIALDKKGRVGIGFTTIKMSWAVIGGKLELTENNGQNRIAYGILPNELRVEQFES
uniref:isoaspartyl peptidase/L-asparaginase-like n=1 Tax=Styela clava TaxID=7725 RepID=UPI001939C205|nr:isoaspartyl peptidase/L-asparaginase-like [Styela clava]